jgi:hypothetical protein
MKFIVSVFFCAAACVAGIAQPQPDHSRMPGMKMSAGKKNHDPIIAHSHISSGTAWQPLALPMHLWSQSSHGWDFMEHGNIFIAYNQQGGRRGLGKFESSNWAMLMQQRAFARGTIQFRQMLSAEPFTFPHGGSPELFQTGETYHGIPLVDHQHPHDVFGELAALYSVPISKHAYWEIYAGPAGEPALGPVTYLHRASAGELEAAPLGHHLQDSTHISYGVITSGFSLSTNAAGTFRVEGSAFNGREPDEDRLDFDFAALDSFSARVSYDPNPNWSMQYSTGYLVHPEAAEPGNINRQTASVEYTRALPAIDGRVSSSLIWGRNRKLARQATQNSYMVESVVNFARVNYAFTRLELVDKDELVANALPLGAPGPNLRIGAFTFGAARDLAHTRTRQIAIGADLTFYSKPDILNSAYGVDPVSLHVFLRLRPGEMRSMQ